MWPHCQKMIKSGISHDGFDERGDEFKKKHFWTGIAENVAMNYGAKRTPEEMAKYSVEQWSKSPGHNKNMLSSNNIVGSCGLCDT